MPQFFQTFVLQPPPRHHLVPQAAGRLGPSVRLSRMCRDDLLRQAAGIALYRWARDGHDEGHDWPQGRRE